MNLRKTGKVISILVIVLTFCVNASAWDEVGHKLSAYIAWQQMEPDVRERVFKILMEAPEDSDLNTPYDAYNSRSASAKKLELFMYASIWPDTIKNRDFEVRNKKYNQNNWHYGDIFWQQDDGKPLQLKDFPVASGLAVSKLSDFERILRDPSFKDEEKAIAVAWFLHVGGDLHQPLHNASRVTDLEKEGDQGGNLFVLVPRSENNFGLNLHSFWDGIIGRVKPRKNDACDADYLVPIGKKIVRKHKYTAMSDRLNLGKYTSWNAEGYNLLNSVVYTNELSRGQIPPRKYEKRAYETAREQIALAGYRIGETFNKIFRKTN